MRTTCRARQAALLLFSVAVLLANNAATVRGQTADEFDPNANDLVRVVVVQPDGKILIGGHFTTLSPNGGAPVTRNRIARLNPGRLRKGSVLNGAKISAFWDGCGVAGRASHGAVW